MRYSEVFWGMDKLFGREAQGQVIVKLHRANLVWRAGEK